MELGVARRGQQAMGSLSGKVALVTGASSGIGRSTAFQLADKGAGLYLTADGTKDELLDVAKQCRERNSQGDVRFGVFDLSRVGAAEELIRAAVSAMGRIDILVNNAAVRRRKPFGEFTQEDFDWMITVNLRSPFFACQEVLPIMRRQGGGRIINVASQRAVSAKQDISLYGISKAGIAYLSQTMAVELAKEGISVNTVSPGPIETQYATDRLADQPHVRKAMVDAVPQGRFGTPEEVAEVIVFLASSAGNYIQGHNILVDGGELAR
jgi:NAD(P)-dependent dehydrogenase (short-subunit alcohol dehydrogenase family)